MKTAYKIMGFAVLGIVILATLVKIGQHGTLHKEYSQEEIDNVSTFIGRLCESERHLASLRATFGDRARAYDQSGDGNAFVKASDELMKRIDVEAAQISDYDTPLLENTRALRHVSMAQIELSSQARIQTRAVTLMWKVAQSGTASVDEDKTLSEFDNLNKKTKSTNDSFFSAAMSAYRDYGFEKDDVDADTGRLKPGAKPHLDSTQTQ